MRHFICIIQFFCLHSNEIVNQPNLLIFVTETERAARVKASMQLVWNYADMRKMSSVYLIKIVYIQVFAFYFRRQCYYFSE